jgi:hypothetical protein
MRSMRDRYRFVLGMRARALLGAAVLLAALSGCSHELGCDIDGVSRDLGGAGLMDCGIASSDIDAMDKCAVANFRADKTFRALYEKKGGSLEGIVHAAGGKYYALRAAADGRDVERAQCKSASIVTMDGRTYVQCDKPAAFSKACD